MIVHACEQRSDEWHHVRLGKLTGSKASDMLAMTKSGEAAGRRNLRVQLVLERLTGRSQETGYTSKAIQDGVDREPDARAMYEGLTGRILESTGFISHDTLQAGVSLDGHVGDDFEGIIEIKSPLPATHLEYLTTGVVPGDYAKQVLHALWITGAQWCDWLSYHPAFPEALQVKLVRIERNDDAVAQYAAKAVTFLDEVEAQYAAVATMADLAGRLHEAIHV